MDASERGADPEPTTWRTGCGPLDDLRAPSGRFLRVVAAGALAVALGEAGPSAVPGWRGVVSVGDRRAAVRRGAEVVTQHEHPAQQRGKRAPTGVHGHEVPPVGPGEESAEPDGAGIGVAQPPAGDRRRDRPVTRDARRLEVGPGRVADTEQGPVGHHQVHLDRLHLPHLPAGEEPQRRVGRDGADPTTGVRFLSSVARHDGACPGLKGRVGPGDLRHRTEDAEVGHSVGGGAHRDPARPHCPLHPGDHRCGIELGRDPTGRVVGLPDSQPCQQRADATVDDRSVGHGEHRGGRRHGHRVCLRTLAGRQGGQGVRHVLDQRTGSPDEPVAARGRLATSQRDFGPHRAADVLRHDLLPGDAHRVHQSSLRPRGGALDPLELADQGDALPVREVHPTHTGQPRAKGLGGGRRAAGVDRCSGGARGGPVTVVTGDRVGHAPNRTYVRSTPSAADDACGRPGIPRVPVDDGTHGQPRDVAQKVSNLQERRTTATPGVPSSSHWYPYPHARRARGS